jgi:hypothetical protein
MLLRRAFLALAAAALAAPAFAGGDRLTAAEIESLLAGNTIEGDWGGMYKQYFEADGTTMYYPEGGEPDPGKWRVNAQTDQYESWWEGTGWVGYDVLHAEEGYLWRDGDGDTHPFTVMEGRQVE